ncbi:MAG: cysteine desulfurase [Ignavibacteria bacterium]|nr:cysteine desulfurase [Ignavibacteria bacterium]
MLNFPIYLDNNSTTKVDMLALEAMLPYFTENYGNSSSKSHQFGWKAEAAVNIARKQTAKLISCEPRDIIFTSGATESINLALKGAAEAYATKGNHIITTKIEHEAVIDSCNHLEAKGFNVTYVDVDHNGIVSIEEIERAITSNTILVSVMWANNEIGTIQPVKEISKLCRLKKILFHTDATQAVGKIPIDLSKIHIDLLSFSSHKLYGPKGVGALYKSGKLPRVRIVRQTDGGAQEKGLRAGTLNVPGIVGFGKACQISADCMNKEAKSIKTLRNRLLEGINSGVNGVKVNGDLHSRLPGNLNLSIPGIDADSLIIAMKDVAVSTGSACSSESVEPSHVLKAIGLDKDSMRSAIRFGIGRFNTSEEIEYVINCITEKVNNFRENSPSNISPFANEGGNNNKVNKGDYAEV